MWVWRPFKSHIIIMNIIIVGFTTSLKPNNIFIINNTYFYKLKSLQR